ncbi:MAG TPA: glycosyltransferase [Lentimicrobium sp.]|nr:glycosyltransferase [Lentimicrobium sp.]
MSQKKPRILVCPLDWGLGHATRCIPVIRSLMKAGAEPVIAADGPQLHLLRLEFPGAEFVNLRGYRVQYSKRIPAGIYLLMHLPRLLFNVYREHRKLIKLITTLDIDGVISDNRYGLWNNRTCSVLITHQVNILPPAALRVFSPVLRAIVRFFIRRYHFCWVPDLATTPNLSGQLSHGKALPENTSYIGLLSRFDKSADNNKGLNSYDIVAIVSGPEPQRSIFEKILINQLPPGEKKCLLLRGLPGDTEIRPIRKNLDVAHHLPSAMLGELLRSGPLVICRAGYSTLMEIAMMGNKAILIPTPGQTEQEYLAEILDKSGIYLACKQGDLNLRSAIEEAGRRQGLRFHQENQLLESAVKALLEKIKQAPETGRYRNRTQ